MTTSKLEDTVKAEDCWQFLETSESKILPEDFVVALQYQSIYVNSYAVYTCKTQKQKDAASPKMCKAQNCSGQCCAFLHVWLEYKEKCLRYDI